jgi:hypothetical protein
LRAAIDASPNAVLVDRVNLFPLAMTLVVASGFLWTVAVLIACVLL